MQIAKCKLQNANFRHSPSAIRHSPSPVLFPPPAPRPPSPRAFTLIEMLVVVSIMMMLLAMAASVFRPANDSRRIREAARSINVYISSARNRAMETGRPCGVILRRFNGQPFALTLEQCEVPPSYAGEFDTAMARVQNWTIDPTTTTGYWQPGGISDGSTVLKMRLRVGDFSNIIRRGDLVQLNGQGPYYSIVDDPFDSTALIPNNPFDDYPLVDNGDPNSCIDFTQFLDNDPVGGDGWVDNRYLTLRLAPIYTQQTPWLTRPVPITNALQLSYWSQPVPFRIIRSPMSGNSIIKNATRTLQLPPATVVDLQFSGIGLAGQFDPTGTSTNDVAILFSPNGAVEGIYNGGPPTPVTDPIFLLVGKRERVPPPTYDANNPDTFANWQDLNNVWVTINPQTGLITTSEVASGANINAARQIARDSQGMGGK